MKSVCIKMTNPNVAEYLLERLYNFKFSGLFFSYRKFKVYYNIIIHYKGKQIELFFKELSHILSYFIIEIYEKNIVDYLVKSEYFYFEDSEINKIINITCEDLDSFEEAVFSPKDRIDAISCSIFNYLFNEHSILLKGFITFRLKKYFNMLSDQISKSVNRFIIEKEYAEFISLLKMYVNSEPTSYNCIHLLYGDSKSILLDQNLQELDTRNEILNSKYLSDISFSTNDYTLNTLLNLIPKKINIHLLNNNADEFINTLKLIFEDRIIICNGCEICQSYKPGNISMTRTNRNA